MQPEDHRGAAHPLGVTSQIAIGIASALVVLAGYGFAASHMPAGSMPGTNHATREDERVASGLGRAAEDFSEVILIEVSQPYGAPPIQVRAGRPTMLRFSQSIERARLSIMGTSNHLGRVPVRYGRSTLPPLSPGVYTVSLEGGDSVETVVAK